MTAPPGVPAELPAKLEHFIGGTPAASADGATFEVADPVSNQPYATVAAGGPRDVDRAVAAAAAAFAGGPWPRLPARARATILNQIADGIQARAARIPPQPDPARGPGTRGGQARVPGADRGRP